MIHYYQSLTEENKGHKRDSLHHCRQISIRRRADIVRFELLHSFEISCANVFLGNSVIISLCVSASEFAPVTILTLYMRNLLMCVICVQRGRGFFVLFPVLRGRAGEQGWPTTHKSQERIESNSSN